MARDKLVNVGGVKINSRKTTAEVAKQLNRIGRKLQEASFYGDAIDDDYNRVARVYSGTVNSKQGQRTLRDYGNGNFNVKAINNADKAFASTAG
ncbi:MAG: hypothetical protein LIP02_04015 [Bacteroidales bacterium]|nr:hypothetical protein [Bacteroidales bacterium]